MTITRWLDGPYVDAGADAFHLASARSRDWPDWMAYRIDAAGPNPRCTHYRLIPEALTEEQAIAEAVASWSADPSSWHVN